MYKILNIGGYEYKLEYSIEASLYADCISNLTILLSDIGTAESNKDVKGMLKGMSSVPQTTLIMFYAGLMEHHGSHPSGDGKVPDISVAKSLISQYIREHAEDGEGNFYSVMEMCINQMAEDGFFNLIGLDKILDLSPKKKTTKAKASEK